MQSNEFGVTLGNKFLQFCVNYDMATASAVANNTYDHRWYGILLFNRIGIGISIWHKKPKYNYLCINNFDHDTTLTTGESYIGTVLNSKYLYIEDDSGETRVYKKELFEELFRET